MSFIKLSKNFQEYSTLVLHPDVLFVSSSAGITGSQYVTHIRTNRIKDTTNYAAKATLDLSPVNDGKAQYELNDILIAEHVNGKVTGLNPSDPVYLEAVNSMPVSAKMRYGVSINRIEPGKSASFGTEQSIKNTVRKNLNTFYKSKYPDLGWNYSNYHTLNFFKTGDASDGSCLMYPNHDLMYTPTSSFSLSFHINPRYDNVTAGTEFDAGTIFHLSSSIAVSLVSGSSVDKKGLVSSYKILLQLSQSADKSPSEINLASPSGTYLDDLIFLSDIELSKNTWNHVTVRWSPEQKNMSGSIVINRRQNHFYVPSSSISSTVNTATNRSCIIVGNHYTYQGADSALARYFTANKATQQGIPAFGSVTNAEPKNQLSAFSQPLQAEIHNVMLFDKYLNGKEILFLESNGVNNRKLIGSNVKSLYEKLLFYLPPFYLPESPVRNILASPYEVIAPSRSRSPFNMPFSFSFGSRLINLENFVANFARPKTPTFPRLQALTASILNRFPIIPVSDHESPFPMSGDAYIFESTVSPQIKKRNLTILPNDNGLFSPDYWPIYASQHLSSSCYQQTIKSFVTKRDGAVLNLAELENIYDYSKISLENLSKYGMVYKTNILPNELKDDEATPDDLSSGAKSVFGQIFGPYNNKTQIPTQALQYAYAIPALTKDVSSNEITIFDISQLYYGNSIKDGSFSIIDSNVSGSNGKIKIRLKDNGSGGLYRADSLTRHAKWNNVGDIIYEEGIVNIKSPHLIKFCKDKTNISFKGEQTLHTMILNVPAFKEYFNSSSNYTYISNPPTTKSNDNHLSTKYITAINIHDDNFNIIMKAHFSQPIVKTEEDEFVIRLKQDF